MTKNLKNLTSPKATRLAATRARTAAVIDARRGDRPIADLTISELASVFAPADRIGLTSANEVQACVANILASNGFEWPKAIDLAAAAKKWYLTNG